MSRIKRPYSSVAPLVHDISLTYNSFFTNVEKTRTRLKTQSGDITANK
jgi:hypothetical protein